MSNVAQTDENAPQNGANVIPMNDYKPTENTPQNDAQNGSGSKTPKSWKTCEITQDCRFGWTLDNIAKFLDGWSSVKDYAYILHDEDLKDDMSTSRDDHCHLMLRFKYPVPTSAIIARAKAVGLPADCITENRIERMKNWSAALNYLTHRDEHKPWKHVYDLSCVISNFDWQLDAEAAHQKKQLQTTDARAKEIVDGIDKAIIREYNIHEHLTMWEQVQYAPQINKAFRVYIDREKQKGERDMQVIFISGASGAGKDSFAADWCKKQGMPYYRTSNNDTHPFDDYKGQPAIIWSDARDDVYKPSQLFALLDNHWKSSQKARYSDINLDCKALLITSIKPLNEWYSEAFKDADEPRKQLYRRVKMWCEVERDLIHIKVYNESTNEYMRVSSLPNTFSHADDMLDTPEKMLEFAHKMMSGYSQALQDTVNYAKEHEPDAYKAFADNTKPVTVGEIVDAMNCTEEEAIKLFHAKDCNKTTTAAGVSVTDNEDGTLQVGIPF